MTRWQYWRPTSHCHRHHWTHFQQPNRPTWPVANLTHQEIREGYTKQQEEEEDTTKVFTNASCTRRDLQQPRHRPRCHGRGERCRLRRRRGSRRQRLQPRRRLDGRCSWGSSLPLCPSPARRYCCSTLYPCDKSSWSVVVSNLRGFEVSELVNNMRMFRRASSVRHGIQAGRGDDETGVGRETGSSRKTRRSLLLGRNGREEVGGSMGSRGRQWEEEMGESTGSRGRMMGGRRRRGMRRELQTRRSGQRLGGKSIDRQVNLQNHHQKDIISYFGSRGSEASSS